MSLQPDAFHRHTYFLRHTRSGPSRFADLFVRTHSATGSLSTSFLESQRRCFSASRVTLRPHQCVEDEPALQTAPAMRHSSPHFLDLTDCNTDLSTSRRFANSKLPTRLSQFQSLDKQQVFFRQQQQQQQTHHGSLLRHFQAHHGH